MSWLDADAPEAQNREKKSFDLLPRGWTPMEITDVGDCVPTSAGTGQRVSVEFTVTAGEHQGRKAWANFNVDNPNPKAVQIAKDQILDIGDAVGVKPKIASPEDAPGFFRSCIGIPLEAKVAVRKSEEYGDSNDLKAYRKAPDARAPSAAPQSKGWR